MSANHIEIKELHKCLDNGINELFRLEENFIPY